MQAAVERLRGGGLVAFPTETVYGLGADATSDAAVERVFRIKQRPANNPLIVHVSGIEMAREVVTGWSAESDALARAFWPGPLTLVLDRAATLPTRISAGGTKVGVRCPDHPLALALIEQFGRPLVGPSANLSGQVSPTLAEHVRSSFTEDEVLVLDGGPCAKGIESTVLLVGEQPRILRPGMVSAQQIAHVLGRDVGTAVTMSEGDAPLQSPGQLASHYAPRTPMWIVRPEDLRAAIARWPSVAVLSLAGAVSAGESVHRVLMPSEDLLYAAALYRALREADGMQTMAILVEAPPGNTEIWQAIWDRLRRAGRPFVA